MTLSLHDSAWNARTLDAVEDLRALLRIPSVNPPGGEGPVADFLEARLRATGAEVHRLSCDGRPNLVARLKGSTDQPPLLLAGHMDVVPVEAEHWKHDPFGGHVDGGYLYGRGAIDMKNMVVQCLHAFELAAAASTPPERDLIVAFVSDEEEGCDHGSRFLVEQHPELVQAGWMLGEVGGFTMDIQGKRYYPVQIAEKGTARLKLTARGEPGHGATPHQANAVVRLGEALAALGRTRLPVHITPPFAEFVEALSATQPPPARHVLRGLLKPALVPPLLDHVLPDKQLAATLAANLSHTVTPTMLEAGQKINLIPGSATALLDGRILPGYGAVDLVAEVRAVIGPHIDIEVLETLPGRMGSSDDPMFRAIVETLRRHDPDGLPLPTMIPGFTDARWFGQLGMSCFGFSPLQFPRRDKVVFRELFHGHNERIHVDGFRWGLGALWDHVARFLRLGTPLASGKRAPIFVH